MRRMVGNLIVVGGAFLAAVALGGCGTQVLAHPGQDVSSAITKAVGQRPKSVSCPSGIEAKVGKKFRCTVTASDGSKIGVTVTETSLANGAAQMSIKADPHAQHR